jgi:hypothetical protein
VPTAEAIEYAQLFPLIGVDRKTLDGVVDLLVRGSFASKPISCDGPKDHLEGSLVELS